MTRYLLIRPDEDGNPIRWLDQDSVLDLLADPIETYGVKVFLAEGEDWDGDPNYWSRGVGMLLRVEIVTPVPAGTYRLPG